MEKNELIEALKEYGQEIDKKNAELMGKKANSDEVEKLKSELSTLENEKKEMQKQLDALDIEIQKVKKVGIVNDVKSFAIELKEQLTKEAAALKGMTERKVKELQLEVKSFLETANASVTTGSLIPQPQFEAGITKAPDRMPFLLDIISTGIANSLTIYWTERKTRTDNSGFVTEGTLTTLGGGAVTESVLGYNTSSASMQNISEFIKVSNNSVDDVDWLLSEVQTELLTLMALKLDAALLTGAVATEGFDGIFTAATAFNAGGATLQAGAKPNKYDALKFAITQIKKANFRPNYIVLNPSDVRDMELERDENGQYLLPPFMQALPGVGGVRVIENNGMTAGSYLVGDFTKAKFWTRKGMEIRIWEQNDDDAVKQLKTVTGYMRGTLVIKTTDKLAFVKDTFADSITEITPAP